MKRVRLFLRKRAKIRSDLLDVSLLDLEQVDAIPGSVLEWSLRRVLRETSRGGATAVSFRSSIAEEDAWATRQGRAPGVGDEGSGTGE